MGERPDPEAKTDDSPGFNFDEASTGFRAAWEDGAEPAPGAAPLPAAEVAAPTQVGLGPVAPATEEPALAPVQPQQPAAAEQPAIQPVAVAPVQAIVAPKPIEPPAGPPAAPEPAP